MSNQIIWSSNPSLKRQESFFLFSKGKAGGLRSEKAHRQQPRCPHSTPNSLVDQYWLAKEGLQIWGISQANF
jgi:hypothetical protein